MEVIATRDVFYNGTWHKAGDTFNCDEDDYAGLEAAGVERSEGKAPAKADKAEKDLKTR